MRRATVVVVVGSILTLCSWAGAASAAGRKENQIAAARADGCVEANTKRRSLGKYVQVQADVRCRSGAYGHWVVMVPKAAIKAKARERVTAHRAQSKKPQPISLKCFAASDARAKAAKAKSGALLLKCWPEGEKRSAQSKQQRQKA